jgi:peptidoglycan hydrolase CwlO-like protein
MQAPISSYGCGYDECLACYGDREYRIDQWKTEVVEMQQQIDDLERDILEREQWIEEEGEDDE